MNVHENDTISGSVKFYYDEAITEDKNAIVWPITGLTCSQIASGISALGSGSVKCTKEANAYTYAIEYDSAIELGTDNRP
jgi:hypothetical protein